MGVFSVLLSHGLSEYRYEKRRRERYPQPSSGGDTALGAVIAVLLFVLFAAEYPVLWQVVGFAVGGFVGVYLLVLFLGWVAGKFGGGSG